MLKECINCQDSCGSCPLQKKANEENKKDSENNDVLELINKRNIENNLSHIKEFIKKEKVTNKYYCYKCNKNFDIFKTFEANFCPICGNKLSNNIFNILNNKYKSLYNY